MNIITQPSHQRYNTHVNNTHTHTHTLHSFTQKWD